MKIKIVLVRSVLIVQVEVTVTSELQNNFFFLFCTYNTVSITLKGVSKRRSFRYAFQEHLPEFFMLALLAVTHSELLLRDHCISRHFKFKTYNCWSIYQPNIF
jgi:hypothetical protein